MTLVFERSIGVGSVPSIQMYSAWRATVIVLCLVGAGLVGESLVGESLVGESLVGDENRQPVWRSAVSASLPECERSVKSGTRYLLADVESAMNRRTFLAALAGTPALAALIAACGDDSKRTFSSIPSGPQDVVIKITNEGGFVPPGFLFVNLPSLLISGDGRVFTPGAMIDIYPGPLLPAITERSITDDGIRKVLQLADDAGLLGEPLDYSLPDGVGIADASDTVVVINVNGKVYEHRANALGFDDSSTPARDNLNTFVTLVSDIAKVAGGSNVGEEHAFEAEQYRFQAAVVDPTQYTDPSPTIVAWPDGAGAVLADSLQCATVAAADVDALFAEATQLTFFEEAAITYQLSAVGVLPGDATC
jgi:hypothetical protein